MLSAFTCCVSLGTVRYYALQSQNTAVASKKINICFTAVLQTELGIIQTPYTHMHMLDI